MGDASNVTGDKHIINGARNVINGATISLNNYRALLLLSSISWWKYSVVRHYFSNNALLVGHYFSNKAL